VRLSERVLDQRGQRLVAALGFAGCFMPSYDRALWAQRGWLDSWSGIGRVAVGMAHQGFDLQLTRSTSAAGARRSTRPASSTRYERGGHRVGVHAVAHDAAGGVGGGEEERGGRPMMRLRRATLLVAFSLLTSATTAGAECAWVLWMQVALSTGGPASPPLPPRHRGPARTEGEVNDTDARRWRPCLPLTAPCA